jgi:hypothetical protein
MHFPAYLTLRIRAPEKAGSLLLGKDDVHSKCKATSSTPRKAASPANSLAPTPDSHEGLLRGWRAGSYFPLAPGKVARASKLNPSFALKELLRPLYSSHRDDPRPAWILSQTVW